MLGDIYTHTHSHTTTVLLWCCIFFSWQCISQTSHLLYSSKIKLQYTSAAQVILLIHDKIFPVFSNVSLVFNSRAAKCRFTIDTWLKHRKLDVCNSSSPSEFVLRVGISFSKNWKMPKSR